LLAAGHTVREEAGPSAPSLSACTLSHLTDDSRRVRPNGAFVAIDGTDVDGHRFIPNAIAAGATLVVCEHLPAEARTRFPSVRFLQIDDTRRGVADLAAAVYQNPSDALRMLGVTGTNGKTTVAFLLHYLLTALGETPGLLSTIDVRIGSRSTDAALTTPGAIALQRTLRTMVNAGGTACAMEVSSHALDQHRVRRVAYDVALFTNLTPEHLDYHGTLDAYRNAKKRLFDGLGPDATAVVNADDDAHVALTADTDASVVTYGLRGDATFQGAIEANTLRGLRMALDGHVQTFRLAGTFNAYNLLAAYGAGRALGYDASTVRDALADAPPVPGRFETLAFDDGPTVVVDYAHTPDALDNVLRALRATAPPNAALWCVFGCGGDRDASKRSTMGRIAETHADHVLVTSDNPRTEDPQRILYDIRRGMRAPDAARWILDREDAIATAARHAAPGDVVLIAGKGHESHQIVGDEKRPFDDRAVARSHFGALSHK
jgi:UDP-N-acetylmuramoyl-L-alanyl-D-glutamate--2,6-diaminopimelate ligase